MADSTRAQLARLDNKFIKSWDPNQPDRRVSVKSRRIIIPQSYSPRYEERDPIPTTPMMFVPETNYAEAKCSNDTDYHFCNKKKINDQTKP